MAKHPSLEWLTIGQAAKYLGVSRDTLRRWEGRGKLKSYRTPGGRRRYTMYDLELAIKPRQKPIPSTPKPLKKVTIIPPPPQIEAKEPVQKPSKTRLRTTIFSTIQILLLTTIIGLLTWVAVSGVGEGLITRLKTGEKIIKPVSETSFPSK